MNNLLNWLVSKDWNICSFLRELSFDVFVLFNLKDYIMNILNENGKHRVLNLGDSHDWFFIR